MNDRQRRIQQLLSLLADRSRFRMLCALAGGPVHVSELGSRVGLSQSCATRHVQALAAAGAVACRREGKRVVVAVRSEDEIVRTLLAWVEGEDFDALAPGATAPTAGRARRARAAPARAATPKEVPPAAGPDSGTPPPANPEDPEPLPPARARALEDFLL